MLLAGIVSRRQATDINRRATANGPRAIVEGYGVVMRHLIRGRTAPVGLTLRWPTVYRLNGVTAVSIIERVKLGTAWEHIGTTATFTGAGSVGLANARPHFVIFR